MCFNTLFGKKATPSSFSFRVQLFFNQPTGLVLSDGTHINLMMPPSSCMTKEGFTSKARFVYSNKPLLYNNTTNLHANLNIHFPGIPTLDLIDISFSGMFKSDTTK